MPLTPEQQLNNITDEILSQIRLFRMFLSRDIGTKLQMLYNEIIKASDVTEESLNRLLYLLIDTNPEQGLEEITDQLKKALGEDFIFTSEKNSASEIMHHIINQIKKRVEAIQKMSMPDQEIASLHEAMVVIKKVDKKYVKLLYDAYLKMIENCSEQASTIEILSVPLSKIAKQHEEDSALFANYDLYNEKKLLLFEQALQRGANPNADQYYYAGQTALHLAASFNWPEMIELLLEQGNIDNINPRNTRGYTPLHEATSGGYEEVVKVLLRCGADPKAPVLPKTIQSDTKDTNLSHSEVRTENAKITALDIANENGHTAIAKILKNHIIKLETKDSKDTNVDPDNSVNDTDSKGASGSNVGNSADQKTLSDMPGNVIDNNDSPITFTSNKPNSLPSDTAEETSSTSYGAGKTKEKFETAIKELEGLDRNTLLVFLGKQYAKLMELIQKLVKQEMSLEDVIKYGIKNLGVDYTKLANNDDSYYRDNSVAELPPLGKTFDSHLPGLNTDLTVIE